MKQARVGQGRYRERENRRLGGLTVRLPPHKTPHPLSGHAPDAGKP